MVVIAANTQPSFNPRSREGSDIIADGGTTQPVEFQSTLP